MTVAMSIMVRFLLILVCDWLRISFPDIKTNNVMAVLPRSHNRESLVKDIQTCIKTHPTETYESLSLPQLVPEPIICVKSQPLPDMGLLPDLTKPVGKRLTAPWQPAVFRPPESIVGFPWSTPSDVWAVGRMAFELVADYHVFMQDDFDQATHIQKITELIGKIPSTFLSECPWGYNHFNRDVRFKLITFLTMPDIFPGELLKVKD
ncbi:uncharacterized protein EV420DRAFT_1763173 [Desarmillaria tabescens]|uniref:Protein kinase domain-containing protein n=1 Tax=Armillaria tabescens TaxID=1929756 RepID=A0AA39KFS2_ARMTA|nr:uncharacterized protein EV420DRAFT_1763173 [Desarmillaria tabescens]KAK0460285.1 hypothetical protein EV420DRAFT_1763173 [Desarmillaria tabescens]